MHLSSACINAQLCLPPCPFPQAQLSGTVHCDFPSWVEFLTHDISVHVPHHVSSKIPWYNLRKAHASLKENWGEYM